MNEIQELLDNASEALYELEGRIREEIQTPEDNIDIKDFNLINLPDAYIRKAGVFRHEYRLNELISDKESRDNIAYSLQLSDLNNYFFNRFNLFWSVGVLFRKQALINIVSIQEALLKCTYTSLREYCVEADGSTCRKNCRCKYYLKSLNKIRNNGLLEIYKDVIDFYDEKVFDLLIEQKAVRDNIHIHNINKNEFKESNNYTVQKYNEAILVLKFLKDNLPEVVAAFKEKRESNCEKIGA